MPATETKFQITDEVLKEALKTSHDACDKPEGCVHANAVTPDGATTMFKHVEHVAASAIQGEAPHLRLWYDGFHVGFRLAQLMYQPQPTEKLN